MTRTVAIAALLLLTTPALAQQPSATELQIQRNQFMSGFAQCDSTAIALQQQLAAAQARVKELETAAAPKPAEPQK